MAQPEMAVDPKRKTPVGWTAMETNILIHVWGEHISDLGRVKRNRHIMEKIRKQLEVEHKVFRATSEVINKINNLLRFYRKEKKLTASSNCYQSEWKHFSSVSAIVDKCPSQEDNDEVTNIAQEDNDEVTNISQIGDVSYPYFECGDVAVVMNSANDCSGTISNITPTTSCGETISKSENSALTTSHLRRNCTKQPPLPSRCQTSGKNRRNYVPKDTLSTVQSILQQQLQVDNDLQKNGSDTLKLLKRQTELQERSAEASIRMVELLSKFIQK